MYTTNAILQLQHFPDQWKVVTIVHMLKMGKNFKAPNSYRPIFSMNTFFFNYR